MVHKNQRQVVKDLDKYLLGLIKKIDKAVDSNHNIKGAEFMKEYRALSENVRGHNTSLDTQFSRVSEKYNKKFVEDFV